MVGGVVKPLDLTNAAGTFTRERAMSIRPCANCNGGIHVGHERINHHPLATSAVAYYYHPECVVIP